MRSDFSLALTSLGFAAALAVPAVGACDSGSGVADQRADHRCGPEFEEAVCGTDRCCSSAGFCGDENQPHCNSLHGFGGAYDGPTGGSSSVSVDCTAFCSHQASVVAELGCTDARSEAACLTACQATASNPAIEPCKSQLAADLACEAKAPTSEYSCSSSPGEAPTLDVGAGSSCGDAVGALLSCVAGQGS